MFIVRARLAAAMALVLASVSAVAAPRAAPAQALRPGMPVTPDRPLLVVRRVTGDSAMLDALPRREIRTDEHGRAAVFAGVALRDVLRAAGVRVDSLRGPALADVLVAEAADGYRVVFALGDLAPDLGNRDVLVADVRDGRPLGSAEGPYRLVVVGDVRPARGARQLRALTVRRLAASEASPRAP